VNRLGTRSAVLLAIGAAFLSFTQGLAAQPFNQVIVFGDSNVDSGYYRQLSSPGGSAVFNADWPAAVADGAGVPTSSPGPENSQVLAGFLGLTANPANTPGGTNYATSGAKNVTVNNAQTGGFTAAIPTVTQIANYLSANAGVANSQALYLIHSGDNDAKYAAGETGTGPFPSNPDQYMTTAADQLATAVQSLFTAGAKQIIVTDLEYSFPKSDATLMSLKLVYTQELFSKLTALGVPVLEGDVNALRETIVANPAIFGFSNVNDSLFACTQPTGVTTAWALLCSSNPSSPSTFVSSTAPQTDLFADDQHLATAGQQLMGEFLYNLVAPSVSPLLAAVLPESRSAQPSGTVTAFATIINTGTTTATGCGIVPGMNVPANFVYQTTNPATNALTGSPNTPVSIPGNNGSQSFVIAFTPTATFPPGNVLFGFFCNDGAVNVPPAPVVIGLNTLLLSASSTPTPDVIALAATTQNDGIVHVTNGSPPTGAFAVATDNLGSSDTITVATNTGSATLPITVSICETNPSTGACLAPPSANVSTTIATNATPTFGIFVSASAAVPLNPANSRVFVTFTDSTNAIRGETSVAVETQ
jgi:phospholipase/lecithinase/hemolysin